MDDLGISIHINLLVLIGVITHKTGQCKKPPKRHIFNSAMKEAGKLLIILGILAVVSGLILLYSGDKLKWLGRLPGDIRIQRENFRFYAPVTTMLLLSILLSFLLFLIGKFFK
jgi:H+/Cl- antiporter ClcA